MSGPIQEPLTITIIIPSSYPFDCLSKRSRSLIYPRRLIVVSFDARTLSWLTPRGALIGVWLVMPRSSTDSDTLFDQSLDEMTTKTKSKAKRYKSTAYSNQWVLQDVTGSNIPKIGDLREAMDASEGMIYMYESAETPKKSCSLFVFNPLNMKVEDLSV